MKLMSLMLVLLVPSIVMAAESALPVTNGNVQIYTVPFPLTGTMLRRGGGKFTGEQLESVTRSLKISILVVSYGTDTSTYWLDLYEGKYYWRPIYVSTETELPKWAPRPQLPPTVK